MQRWLKFAKYLPEFGYEVHVLTVSPDKATYPQVDESLLKEVPSNINVHYTNTSEPYAIYNLFGRKAPSSGFANETVHGVSGLVKKLARFIRGNIFIPDPRKGWNKFAIPKAKQLIDELGIETVITTSPPHSTQLIGLELKKTKTIQWIADMRDPWTKIYYVSELLQTAWARKKNEQLERAVLENADRVITVSESLAREFCELAPKLNSNKVEVLPNGYDEDDFQFSVSIKDEFTIGYMGTMTEQYDTSSLFPAISGLESQVEFCFVGDLPGQVREKFMQVSSGCEFTGYLNHGDALRKAAACSMLLLVIPKIEDNKGILTGKLFEYLALNRPILGIGPVDGNASSILNETGAGKMFDYTDVQGIQQFISDAMNSKDGLETHANYSKYARRNLTKSVVDTLENYPKFD